MLRTALSQLFHTPCGCWRASEKEGGVCQDEGRVSLGRRVFKPEVPQVHIHPDTPTKQRIPGEWSLKPLLGSSLPCLVRLFTSGQICLPFFSPSSPSFLIHLSQLQSSPAMKGSDPEFYFSPGNDAWRLSEIYATTGDNELSSGRLDFSTGS